MSLFVAQVHPGQALGFLALGATLHDILTRLKAEPQRFPKLDLIFEHSTPVTDPVILRLPANGIRLRFDGPEQRLRLIEVLDFTKNQLSYNNKDVLRPGIATQTSSMQQDITSGPTFRHIYKTLIGPTFPGEYIPPDTGDDSGMGLYVLSYPGIAFSFPVNPASWNPGKDPVSLLSSSNGHPATSMAIFSGDSWPDARDVLFTQAIDPRGAFAATTKAREPVADEVRLTRIHGEGRIELQRLDGVLSSWIQLGSTTPQELVAMFGPPDAIYRKNDQRMSIHKNRTASRQYRPDIPEPRLQDDSTDTDVSSAHTTTDDSDEGDEVGEVAGKLSGECFYNYFYHGFDILIANPTPPSQPPPSTDPAPDDNHSAGIIPADTSSRVVATKFILHGNVPGSYPFNRHRRCRWEIPYLSSKHGKDVINSETPFKDTEKRLQAEWKSIYKDADEARSRQRGMVLNRDWGDSPGSSVELLGGWEDSIGAKRTDPTGTEDAKGLGNTTLFGFPGLVFEVLNNGTVCGLTVF